MKKILYSTLFASTLTLAYFLTVSFTSANGNEVKEETNIKGNIDFKIENNTGSEFKYCVNGGHNYISAGNTKSFSYSVGQDFYYIEGSNCGKQWFEVTSDMAGKTFKLSDMK